MKKITEFRTHSKLTKYTFYYLKDDKLFFTIESFKNYHQFKNGEKETDEFVFSFCSSEIEKVKHHIKVHYPEKNWQNMWQTILNFRRKEVIKNLIKSKTNVKNTV